LKKILAVGIAVLVLLVSLTGCDKESTKIPDEPPSITITAGDVSIDWRVGKNKWGGMPIEHIADFPNIMSHTTFDDLPYIKNGEFLTIKFDKNAPCPESYTLTEYILKEDGTSKYSIDGKVCDFNILLSTGSLVIQPVGSFIVEPNYATAFSSYSGDYEAGNTIKGYRLVCTWGGNECEYVFVIRGDAAITLEHDNLTDIQFSIDNVSFSISPRIFTNPNEIETIFAEYESANETVRYWTDMTFSLPVQADSVTIYDYLAPFGNPPISPILLFQETLEKQQDGQYIYDILHSSESPNYPSDFGWNEVEERGYAVVVETDNATYVYSFRIYHDGSHE